LKPLLLLPLALLVMLGPASALIGTALDVHCPQSPLRLIRAIELPDVKGRIDHMALDDERNHLFVAEYGNGSVDDIDLVSGQVAGRITSLREPQGVAWLPAQHEIAVASGDGSLRFYRGENRQLVAVVQLGDDADNVRVDPRNGNLVVGYGSGALAVVDASAHRVIRQLQLPGHPEAFALLGSRVFVNVPDAREIVVADLDQGRVIREINTGIFGGNYPMALDAKNSRIAVAYRFPSRLAVMDANSGTTSWSAPICGDADDLFFRAVNVGVVCGDGAVELVSEAGDHSGVRVATRQGARTGLIKGQSNILYIALPVHGARAAIWELSFR
jgi:hypothetical protein